MMSAKTLLAEKKFVIAAFFRGDWCASLLSSLFVSPSLVPIPFFHFLFFSLSLASVTSLYLIFPRTLSISLFIQFYFFPATHGALVA
jgi:hypothetical protein